MSRVRRPIVGLDEPRVVAAGFHERVFAVVREIPRGRVATYGQIGGILGSRRVARQVGFAMAAVEPRHRVPWHRVVNAQGRISGDDERVARQRALLEREGVEFDRTGRIDLRRFGWNR